MSRSTQYIGLTRQAMSFLVDYQKVEDSDNHTLGMFEEEVPLGVWKSEDTNKPFFCIVEKVQYTPWSSGMMIFTCLYGYFHNDKECKSPIEFGQWVVDPREKGEFNYEKGTMWV